MRPAGEGRSELTSPLAWALVALFVTGGCSWVFTQPLREDRAPYDAPVCSSSLTPPMIDTVLFALNAGTTIYTAAAENVSHKALGVSIGATAATVWLLSAIYGYTKTSACAEAIAGYDHGYRAPALGTGGEVFTPPPPPPNAHPPGGGEAGPALAPPSPAPESPPGPSARPGGA